MELRITTEPQQGADHDDLLRAARIAESAGYDGFFRSDHFLPVDGGAGLPGPSDAWVTLAALARETSRIRLGTLVTAATFRLPGPLAIAVAQVDRMSGGRVEFGVGAGWFEAEHRAYGIPFPGPAERFDALTEQLEVITGLWATPPGERFSFAGKHYTLLDAPALPKPAQHPGPPVVIGGAGRKRTPYLAARYAAEFNANFTSPQEALARFRRVEEACRSIGRDPSGLVRSAAHTIAVGRDDLEVARRRPTLGPAFDEMLANGLVGTVGEVVEKIGRWRESTGITRLYLQLFDITDLDQLELIASDVVPQLD
ncbi:LLM class F420-dependent oxidoreductase [Streptomyces echinoruber]|uniref:LLM class F420-dependent oxidoreductase n=2 Tax=Streptomyces TaxID=1883 RepID=A0A918VH46_9ACTN|nr:LLM class F420-dependent oxidoreductase [Streptomyces echinoruber]AOZ61202.1 F420-dependent oxidoreductase [Streptomyces sp. KIB-H033]GGZ97282.1 LLM class F420-dependent oxidoreductase [Streptomyces echinoruber]